MAKEALFGHKEIAKIVNKKTFLVVSGGGETICDNSFLGRFFSDIPNASPRAGRHFREIPHVSAIFYPESAYYNVNKINELPPV